MAVNFLSQAQLRYPDNADVSQRIVGIGNAIADSIREGRNRNALMKVSEAMNAGDMRGASAAAFESGDPRLAMSVNSLLENKQNRAEDHAFRQAESERAQKNADRSFGLQQAQIGETRALRREQFEFNKKVQEQNFQLKLKEIESKNQKLDNILTPGQKAVDKQFADDYVQFRVTGGYADVDKQLKQLEEVATELERPSNDPRKKTLTGNWVGAFDDKTAAAMGFKDMVAAKERVADVTQRNLRAILGGQFAQKEGDALIARAYNPQLSDQENASRLRALAKQMRAAAKAKQEASDYFEQNGTLAGFKGVLPSMGGFDLEVKPEQNDPLGIR